MSRQESAAALPVAKVAAWRVARQHLLPGHHAPSPEDVARGLVGVQAQVVSAAAHAVAARRARGRVAETGTALAERRLVRSWAMRGTLHLFAADDLPVVIAAIGRRERWRRPKWLEWFRLTEPEMEAAIEMVGEILDDGRPRSRRELHDELVARLGPRFAWVMRSSWGTFLDLATNRGYLCHAEGGDGGVRFVRPRRWLETWPEVDGDAALRSLIERYLAAYGPASLREITRWWGLENQRELAPVIGSLGDRLTTVDVGGEPRWVRTDDVPAIEAAEPLRGSVQLLGPFDPLIVGGGLRDHLIPAAHLKRVSRTAGWISPVVLVDGVVAGVWDLVRSPGRVTVTIELFEPASRARRAAVERAAGKVGEVHGAAVDVAFGPVFTASPARPAG